MSIDSPCVMNKQNQSTVAPDALTTFAHFAISARTKRPNSSGAIAIGSAPSNPSRSFASAAVMAPATSPLILAASADGSPAGPNKPNHDETSKPDNPAAVTVGTSGKIGERELLVTAS